MERRLVVIGDGKIFENRGEYYVQGPANLSIFNVFQGINEIVLWSRIYTISDEEVEKYSKYDFSVVKGRKVSISFSMLLVLYIQQWDL